MWKEPEQQVLAGWNTWYNESLLNHVLLPWGLTIELNFRKKSSGDLLKNTMINRDPPQQLKVDVRSLDGAYTCLHLRHGTTPIKVESAVKDGEQVILITPHGYYTSDEQLIVSLAFLWGMDGTVTKKNGRLGAVCPDGREVALYTNTAPEQYYLPGWHAPSMFFSLNAPVVISTVPCTTQEACRLMGEARAAVLTESRRYGDHGETFQSMQSVLGWNTIYDPCRERVCSPVTRNWIRHVPCKLFCWDTFFGAMMLAKGGADALAWCNVHAKLADAKPNGMVPNIEETSHSQPQVGSLCVAEIYKSDQNIMELQTVYPALLKWNTWYYENRMMPDGTMCWGDRDPDTGAGSLFGAKCESGMDNAPAFDDAVRDPETGMLMQADVGLTGLFIRDCDALMQLATELGRTDDIAILQERKNRAKQGLALLWNEADGIFENKDLLTGQWVNRLSPMNFFALYSDDVTMAQKRRMMDEYLLNPDEFWGEWVLPSISRRDCAFEEQHYWRGRIWAPLNFLVYDALKCAGLTAEAKMLAEKSEKLLLKEWREHRHVHENYSAVDGTGCSARQSDAFYHWGALLGYMALDAQTL
jgi:hypothetical protein